jgi:hypothetical protein
LRTFAPVALSQTYSSFRSFTANTVLLMHSNRLSKVLQIFVKTNLRLLL